MTAKQIHVTRSGDNSWRIVGADDYLHSPTLALEYTKRRWKDAEMLMNEMVFTNHHLICAKRCAIYGHSIVWDVAGRLNGSRHAGLYEILPRGEDDPVSYLQIYQIVAYILAKNW